MTIPKWGDDRRRRVGVFGGSFNPAHRGHIVMARQALKWFGLDQVWMLISPGNPLKDGQFMAPYHQRRASVTALCDGRHIVPCDLEYLWGVRFTAQTLVRLRQFFPHVAFMWLMGADSLCTLPRWYRWEKLFHSMPIVVFPRPGYNVRALGGEVSVRMQRFRVNPSRMRVATPQLLPMWCFPLVRQEAISASFLRRSAS